MPIRTCLACRRRAEQGELLRFTVDAAGRAHPDGGARRPGRGSYVCPTEECWDRLRRRARRRGPDVESSEVAFRLAIRRGLGENGSVEVHEN